MDNKEIDLPSQKEILAMYRCDEIMETTFSEFQTGATGMQRVIEEVTHPNFGSEFQALFNTALGFYHHHPFKKEKKILFF
jgi:hypothetical protein